MEDSHETQVDGPSSFETLSSVVKEERRKPSLLPESTATSGQANKPGEKEWNDEGSDYLDDDDAEDDESMYNDEDFGKVKKRKYCKKPIKEGGEEDQWIGKFKVRKELGPRRRKHQRRREEKTIWQPTEASTMRSAYTLLRQRQEVTDRLGCSVCGSTKFDTKVEAHQHQLTCSGKDNIEGPWLCVTCGKNEFIDHRGFKSHRRCCYSGIHRGVSFSLKPEALHEERSMLSDFGYLLTETLILVEAAPEDTVTQMGRNRRRQVESGNIGVACSFCHASGDQVAASVIFPDNLKTLPIHLYNIASRHLIKACPTIPTVIRAALISTKKIATSQSCRKGGLGIPTYLKLVFEEYGLTDDGTNKGVRQITEKRYITIDDI